MRSSDLLRHPPLGRAILNPYIPIQYVNILRPQVCVSQFKNALFRLLIHAPRGCSPKIEPKSRSGKDMASLGDRLAKRTHLGG